MSINFQTTPFGGKVTILDDNKYCLFGDPIEGNAPGKMPKLFFSIRGNYPHIRIKLNNGKQKEEGNIDLALDLIAYMSVIECIDSVANSKEPQTHVIAVKRSWWDKNNNKPGEPYIAACIYVGRDNDGECFIGIQRGKNKEQPNYLKMKFRFTAPEFHPLLDAQTHVALDKAQTSNVMARAWVRLLTSLVPLINANIWDYNITNEGKFALKQKGGDANNGGGYNNGGNNNYRQQQNNQPQGYGEMTASNNSAPAAESEKGFDDDFPW